MATPGHFLEKTTGVMPLSTTIWSPAAIILVVTFTVAVMIVGCVFMPKHVRPISEFVHGRHARLSRRRVAASAAAGRATFAQWLEHTPLVMAPLALMLAGWLYHHFFVKNLSLDINSVNTIVLFLGVVLHGNVLPIHEGAAGRGRTRLADRAAVSPVRRRRRADSVHAGRRFPRQPVHSDPDAATRIRC